MHEEEETIDNLVNFLKDDLEYVNVFLLTFKETDKRMTLALQSMVKLLGRMFGSHFWNYAMVAATHWGYDARKMAIRNSSGYDEESWTRQINHLFQGLSPQPIGTVFIDSFYDVGPSDFETEKFFENSERLLNFSIEQTPFECKDIEKAVSEIREQQKMLEELLKAKQQLETEKNNLIFTIDLLKVKNDNLLRNYENLTEKVRQFKIIKYKK